MKIRFIILLLCIFFIQVREVSAESWQDVTSEAIKSKNYSIAESALILRLEENTNDMDARFLLAQVLSWQGKFEASREAYNTLINQSPQNSDYIFGLAQTFVWDHQPDVALPLINQAIILNPTSIDIQRLRIQAYALSLFDTKQTQDDIDRKFNFRHSNQISVSFGRDQLTNNNPTWHTTSLDFEHRFAPRQIGYFTVQNFERYYLTDQQMLVGIYQPVNKQWTLNAEMNFSPAHRFVAKNSEMASLQYSFGGGLDMTGGIRQSEYNAGNSTQVFGNLDYYFANYRVGYRRSNTHSAGTAVNGNRFQLSYYYNDISFINLNYGFGKEVERDQLQRRFFDTHFYGLNGRHWINQDWAITWDVSRTFQDTAYTRTGVQIGLRCAF
jgi:YaiO family outer membrane protein